MIAKSGRYSAHGPQAEFEPGSRGRVLRNMGEIRLVREMARRESEALLVTTQRLIDETTLEQQFTASDICRMHKLWLGGIYSWAGEYRSVNMTKGSFMFAPATRVPGLMQEFEDGALGEYTPCINPGSRRLGSGLVCRLRHNWRCCPQDGPSMDHG